jgi:ABC-2 type transport system permease protein
VLDTADADAAVQLDGALRILATDADTRYEVSTVDSPGTARESVENGDLDAALIVERSGEQLDFTIVTSSGDAQGGLAQLLVAASSAIAIQDRVDQTGLGAAQVQQVFSPPEVIVTHADPDATESDDDAIAEIVNYVIAYAATIIIFVFVTIYGQWIAQGVVEEKASRIMEIMVNAATPRDLLAGKVIGIMVTALMQFVPMALTIGIIASFQKQIGGLIGVEEADLFNINFGSIAWSSMGWFLLYFVLGFLLFGALYAGVGSLVSRQEEVATAVAPMTTIMMVGYFAALLSLTNPDGTVARIAYLFPGTSVFVAMMRLVNGNPEPWEIAASIIGLLIAIVLAMLLAARLYRVGVLMYGQPPKLKDLLRVGKMQGVAR